MRQAVIHKAANDIHVIRRYLPSNFQAYTFVNDVVIIGNDEAGWTLEDYVIPRLRSGLFFPKIVF